jgi:hypothetical protein
LADPVFLAGTEKQMLSKLNRLLLCSVVIGISTTSCVLAVSQEEKEFYIQGTSGPYRGRVIDARTKQPISGAVVVAAWYRDVFALVQNNTEFYDAVEVLTDDQGYFVVDAPEIERRAPWRTSFPDFTIFKPGYKYYRGWFASEKEMAQRKNKPLLGVIELEPNVGRGRAARLRNFPPHGDVPNEKMPNLLRAEQEETEALRHERLP